MFGRANSNIMINFKQIVQNPLNFEDDLSTIDEMFRVDQINIRSGRFIDQIQLILTDGIQRLEFSPHGGNGGNAHTYKVPTDHRITQIEVWSAAEIDALRFKTNKGH